MSHARGVRDQATLDPFRLQSRDAQGHAASAIHYPLGALGAAYIQLMRIIPDSEPGYSDILATVKRYLRPGSDSSIDTIVWRVAIPFPHLGPPPVEGGSSRVAIVKHRFRSVLLLPLPDAHRKGEHRLKAQGLVELKGAAVRTANDQGKSLEAVCR